MAPRWHRGGRWFKFSTLHHYFLKVSPNRQVVIMKKLFLICLPIPALTSCASIANHAHVPVALSFSDGSSGECFVGNKRMSTDVEIPSSPLIWRSNDNLVLRCTTEDSRIANASVPSKMGGKIVASAVFIDFGIRDAITNKHRKYLASFVIPIKKK